MYKIYRKLAIRTEISSIKSNIRQFQYFKMAKNKIKNKHVISLLTLQTVAISLHFLSLSPFPSLSQSHTLSSFSSSLTFPLSHFLSFFSLYIFLLLSLSLLPLSRSLPFFLFLYEYNVIKPAVFPVVKYA